ncbi:hypothetical protein DPMN_085052 [Dreissena polymorpha]|uniref:Uncharacterized protein n=1 Tax=Dreissena polymorpha TaxID=45954 RepID=A0A9D3YG37_DREPO|nr:hypothetical protein DPMN_085052 [Dreissena polymorpha]
MYLPGLNEFPDSVLVVGEYREQLLLFLVPCLDNGLNYLHNHVLTGTEKVIIYKDGCGYQNRNAKLPKALSAFANVNRSF